MTMTSTISEFVWPRPALASCIGGMVVRDTRGCALDQTQRFNSQLVCTFAGDAHVIDQPDQMERPGTGVRMPSFIFHGTLLEPSITWNSSEVCVIYIGFYPDALSAMTGINLSSFKGRAVPAQESLPQPMLEACRNFFDAVPHEGIERSFSVLQDKIEIMWAGVRPAGPRSQRSPADWWFRWSRSLVHRATVTGSGRSTRQIARRVKSWTGVGERDLQGLSHAEQLYLKMLEATRKGDVDWAALAAESGFSDQAHMIRRWQKYTGFTPKQLRESAGYEALWYYRLIGQASDQHLARPKRPSETNAPGAV
jgi:hypothetical protein